MSKILETFDESGLEDLIDCELGGQNYELIHGLLAHVRALETLLGDIQWNATDGYSSDAQCPECLNSKQDGHSPDCELARLIE